MIQTKVSFQTKSKITSFLSVPGAASFQREIDLVQDVATKRGIPLEKINVHLERDVEVRNWKYVVVELFFKSTLDEAYQFYRILCSQIDLFESTLDMKIREALTGKVFYVFETI